MKICDEDTFFTVDVPVLRIRRSTSAEVARREARWAKCSGRKLRRRLALVLTVARETMPLVPWRELAAGWRQILATFEGVFERAGAGQTSLPSGGPMPAGFLDRSEPA
jgi:hypothetical protein